MRSAAAALGSGVRGGDVAGSLIQPILMSMSRERPRVTLLGGSLGGHDLNLAPNPNPNEF